MISNSNLRREATFQDLLPRESSTSRQASLVELRYAKGMSARCSVCCSVLQCVAVRCSVLQCVTVCCLRESSNSRQAMLEELQYAKGRTVCCMCVEACCSV